MSLPCNSHAWVDFRRMLAPLPHPRIFVSLRSKSRDRRTRKVVQMQRRMVTPYPHVDCATCQNSHKWLRPVIVATTGVFPLAITFVSHRSKSRDRWTRAVAQMSVGFPVAGIRQALSHQPESAQSNIAVFLKQVRKRSLRSNSYPHLRHT